MHKGKCVWLLVFLSILILTGCRSDKVEVKVKKVDGEVSANTLANIEIPVILPKSSEEEPDFSNGIIVSLDPGHQAPEVDMSALEPNGPGASEMKRKATGGTVGKYSGVPEYQLNLKIAQMVREELVNLGYQVIMTREDDQTAVSNAERAMIANEAGADIAVRIHANGSENTTVSGALALIPSSANPYVGDLYEQSYYLAECVLGEYCKTTGFVNRGIQTNDTMTGINWSRVPVVILEMGFMSNQSDDLQMNDENFQKQMVQGIVSGIVRYFT